MRNTTLPIALLLAVPIDAAAGQAGRVVDQGSFTITVNGRTAGRESFRVTEMTRGDGTVYLATGEVTFGDRTIEPSLSADGTGAAIEYQVKVRGGGADETWQGGITRGRLNAKLESARGTAAREYMVPAGAIILDDDVIHHHWLLGLRARDGRAPVLVPRRNNAQVMITVSTVGEERLQIGTSDVAATHLRATESGGLTHDVWVDRSGRLLKVAIPSRSLVAVRDDPPPA